MKTYTEKEIQKETQFQEKRLAEYMIRLQENFAYELPWVARPAFEASHTIKIMNSISEYGLERTLKSLAKECSQYYNVRKNSTCEITNSTSSWEFELNLRFLGENGYKIQPTED